jgi:4-amino-4-deoxy-L-arabinose transferase-like glycosyltransferase
MELSVAEAPFSASPRLEPNRAAKNQARNLSLRKAGTILTMAILLGFGVFLRLYPSAGYHHVGFDEHGYMVFVTQIQKAGIWNYDAVVHVYVERQYKLQEAVVPAMRLAFLVPAALCADAFGLPAFRALHVVAATAGVLLLFLCALFAYRMGGTVPMIGMTALFATAPLQIYFCQRALIDGYFAFWTVAALWLAWENLQCPKHLGWLISYTLCLSILVLTKENAAFVVFAIFALLLLNCSLRIGTVTPQLLAATVIGPALAVLLLIALVGGFSEWIHFYLMFVAKSRANFYSIAAQDGPWYRYAVDFVILSPVLVAFACGRIFQLKRFDRPDVFMTAFLALVLIPMSSVAYGMSLRYAAFCDVALCWLAVQEVLALSRRFSSFRFALLATALFVALSTTGVSQYVRFFVTGKVYDPVTACLIWASGMEKDPRPIKKSPQP